MKRALSLLLLGMLSATAIAQELTLPDYTKAEIMAAAQYCLEAFKEQAANVKRFPIEEFDMPISSKKDVLNTFTACVLYRLENDDVEIVPLS